MLAHKPTPDGFNLADCTRHIEEGLQLPIVILGWTEINEKRYNEFKKYMAMTCPVHGASCKPSNKPTFTIHQGGKKEPPGDEH